MEASGESTLRAKYLDWCSARLAERFLDLSPEEIYALARPEEADAPEPADPPEGSSRLASAQPASESSTSAAERDPLATRPHPPLPRPTDEGYRVLVQRVTEVLLRRTSLPTFEQWAEAYAETPERFEAELLGFWKDALDGDVGDPSVSDGADGEGAGS